MAVATAPPIAVARDIPAPRFDEVYDAHFDFIWRSVRRLGVPESATDDVVQDVFVIAYRKLSGFEGRSTVRTWLYGIARRVVSDYRRAASRRKPHTTLPESMEADGTPHDDCARQQAARVLRDFLQSLPEEQREVFVLAELEQMTAPEIVEATGSKLNTVYSRLRLARKAFERRVQRERARDGGRHER